MQAGDKRKTWDSNRFRQEHMTFWPRTHPVMFPHLQTDHWTKMKTMVPVYLASLPTTLLEKTDTPVYKSNGSAAENKSNSLLPPLIMGSIPDRPKTCSYQHMPQYRNVYNDRARMGFCYWLIEKEAPTCKGYSFGAYKTFLGLPKV